MDIIENRSGTIEDRVGIDTGGTFTDFVLLDAQGQVTVHKRASTPHDPGESLIAGLLELRAAGLETGFTLVHGTTTATNALLERRGASTALLTTQGFRDVLDIGRQARIHLYALHATKPDCLLPRERRLEVVERVDWQGEVLTPLDEASAAAALDVLVDTGVESLAVCLLFSYLNPAHERRIAAMARERGLMVTLSCEVAPEPREYERTSTTAANAYVAPIMASYLRRLAGRLSDVGGGLLRVMQSNGGALSAEEAAAQAIKTALSGPAAGVIAAAHVGMAAGYPDLLTFDMGGTSTDVALLTGGRCEVMHQGEVAGLPLLTPMLDIHTVGAGGGSLARLDAAGGLRVGPQSAGAVPGPVAYGQGDALTVTDANVMLGRLPAGIRLAGSMTLDVERVRQRFERFARQLGCTPERAAQGVIEVVNAAMARALGHISLERGHDPAGFALMSFGGAGGLHACELADLLNIEAVIVPRTPGAFSALGLALADVRREYAQSLPAGRRADIGRGETRRAFSDGFREMLRQAERDMAAEGFAPGDWVAERAIALRYVGQSFALRIPVNARIDLAQGCADFHRVHRSRYGHSDAQEPVEVTALRLTAVGTTPRPPIRMRTTAARLSAESFAPIYHADGWLPARLHMRADLEPGRDSLSGPCIVVQDDATTYVPMGWSARVDDHRNLIVRRTP